MIYFLQGLLLFSLFINSFAYEDDTEQNQPVTKQSIPVFRIDAHNKNGHAIGTDLGQQIKARFPNIEAIADTYMTKFLSQDLFNFLLKNRVDIIKHNIPSVYQEELHAMAATWTLTPYDQVGDGLLSMNELWLLQLIPDMGRFAHCSGFGVWGEASATHSPIVGRNLDWYTDEGIRSLQAITVYDYGDSSVVNIGFAGYIGVLTGFNHHGLFVAFLDSPLGLHYAELPAGERSSVFDLREILQKNTNTIQAVRYLNENRYNASHNILLADSQHVQVLEQPEGESGHLRTYNRELTPDLTWGKKQQIAVVNCFALKASPYNCYTAQDSLRWYRFKQLARFNSSHPAHVNDISNIMFDQANRGQEIFNQQTVQSVIFTPKDRKLYFYAAPIAALPVDDFSSPDLTHVEMANLIPQTHFPNKNSWYWFSILIISGFSLVIAVGYGEYPRLKTWWYSLFSRGKN